MHLSRCAWFHLLGPGHLLNGELLATTFPSSLTTVSSPGEGPVCSAPLRSLGRSCPSPAPCPVYHVQAQKNHCKVAWDLTLPVAGEVGLHSHTSTVEGSFDQRESGNRKDLRIYAGSCVPPWGPHDLSGDVLHKETSCVFL